jgi:hypothetical protein
MGKPKSQKYEREKRKEDIRKAVSRYRERKLAENPDAWRDYRKEVVRKSVKKRNENMTERGRRHENKLTRERMKRYRERKKEALGREVKVNQKETLAAPQTVQSTISLAAQQRETKKKSKTIVGLKCELLKIRKDRDRYKKRYHRLVRLHVFIPTKSIHFVIFFVKYLIESK